MTTTSTAPHQTPTKQEIINTATTILEPVRTLQIQSKAAPSPPPTPAQSKPFPVLSLPPELLHQIATEYFASLPSQTITPSNLHLPLHDLTPLTLALTSPNHSIENSPLPPSLYYTHTTFLFSAPSLLQPFSTLFNRAEKVRKVKVWYGAVRPFGLGRGREDWVFKLLSCFQGLEEVGFVVEAGMGEGCDREMHRRVVGAWWECVRDAVREGVNASVTGNRRTKGLVLSIECERLEEWRERISGGGK
ncbi:hypothetical protein DL95DRAFT_464007 [Leptodontidium sp. 2 PMI_412]|nr:hypothetical protein DL95DRAFT_464007 [Leptodontidium sp. 2 PMI_412]